MFRTLRIASLAACALVLTACETTEDTSSPTSQPAMGMLNTTCPMSGEPVDADARTVTYDGKTIGLCCGACVKPWNKKTDAEKAGYIAGLTK